jgi:hypothetical protein
MKTQTRRPFTKARPAYDWRPKTPPKIVPGQFDLFELARRVGIDPRPFRRKWT